jgi:hypothetical protein
VGSAWPVEIEASGAVSAGTVLWRQAGRTTLTIVVKATCALTDGKLDFARPAALVTDERFGPQSRSLVADADLAPHKPRAEVTFVGAAWSSTPVTQLVTRLGVKTPDDFFDRALLVSGDRAAPSAAPAPFQSLPIVWERTWAEPAQNPVGVLRGGALSPNVTDPSADQAPAGYGPLSRAWAARARFVGRGDPRSLVGSRLEMPTELSWGFFLAAPPDQQLPRLSGSEILLLEHLVEGRPRVVAELPGARVRARFFGPAAPRDGASVETRLDTIAIDGYERVVHLVWRGTMAFTSEQDAPRCKIVVSLDAEAMKGAVPVAAVVEPRPSSPSLGTTASMAGSSPSTVRITAKGLGSPAAPPAPPPAPPPPAPPPPRSSNPAPQEGTMPIGRALIGVSPADDLRKPYELDDDLEMSSGGGTMAIAPEAAMQMIAARATPWDPSRGPPPAPPAPAPAPPTPLAPTRTEPALVVRPGGFSEIDEEESAGSTMAITPEAAAELLARRQSGTEPAPPMATPPDPLPPAAAPAGAPRSMGRSKPPVVPPPAPPPPIPPAPARHGTIEMESVPDSAGPGTMVLPSPEDPKPRR